ncbi:helix-turn-helix domain-containing protein [Rothia koreensis]|uniref:helix-turn-helix domain-containing protein n=1 Tax=Rothia koreensis TaxID=592378 RepID=UPI003FCE8E73
MRLDVAEAAAYLKECEDNVRKYFRTGKIAASKIGKGGPTSPWRTTTQALDEYIENQQN